MPTPSKLTESRRSTPRQPQQQRSRERVQRLIDAADEILGSEDYESLTVRRIADVAGVPVGSIYQFFADKDAIVDAVARRYLDQFAGVMDDLIAQSDQVAWSDLTDTLLDSFIDMYRSNPGYLTIWLGHHLSAELQAADDANNEALANGIRHILIVQERLDDGEELLQICRVAVSVGDALLQLAFRTTVGGDPALITEAKRIERLYLEDVIARRRT